MAKTVRIIMRRTTRDQGYVHNSLETLDIDNEALYRAIHRGGYGAGPNGDDFDYTEVIGAEIPREDTTHAS